MTQTQFNILFPNASESTKQRNAHLLDTGTTAIVEPDPRARTLGTCKAEKTDHGRFRVRVESVRKRLIDIDNLCEKYVVDCCRYAGLISDDNPEQTQIEVSQRKCAKGEAEHINVSVERLI